MKRERWRGRGREAKRERWREAEKNTKSTTENGEGTGRKQRERGKEEERSSGKPPTALAPSVMIPAGLPRAAFAGLSAPVSHPACAAAGAQSARGTLPPHGARRVPARALGDAAARSAPAPLPQIKNQGAKRTKIKQERGVLSKKKNTHLLLSLQHQICRLLALSLPRQQFISTTAFLQRRTTLLRSREKNMKQGDSEQST